MSDAGWAGADIPFMCLRDRARTLALEAAIRATVRSGDVVLDAGTGTGILALFAARAGAKRVYAVEMDPVLCRYARETVKVNGFADVIEVVEGDIADFSTRVDVAVMELLDTGLIEERFVEIYNGLVSRGVITSNTRTIPDSYATYGELVEESRRAYGFEMVTLRHEWSFYNDRTVWTPMEVASRSDRETIWEHAFDGRALNPTVERELRFAVSPNAVVNGLRISGGIGLGGKMVGAFPSLNGEKIVPLSIAEPLTIPGRLATEIRLYVSYVMSAGFGQFVARVIE